MYVCIYVLQKNGKRRSSFMASSIYEKDSMATENPNANNSESFHIIKFKCRNLNAEILMPKPLKMELDLE